MKINKGITENLTKIAKKNQIGGIQDGLCPAEMNLQKSLMIGNLLEITGINQKHLMDKWTFFKKNKQNHNNKIKENLVEAELI